MSLLTALRLNMTNIADPAVDHAGRYRAALDMAEHADKHGFTAVSGEEHHLAATSWLPSPLILAAAVAGRTRRVRISINALIVPLYTRFGSPRTSPCWTTSPRAASASWPEWVTGPRNTTRRARTGDSAAL